jgi:hypothetical protein
MKVTEEMIHTCYWIKPSTKKIAIKDYVWYNATGDKTLRKVRYDEKNLLRLSLEGYHDSGIITHPNLGDVYAMPMK